AVLTAFGLATWIGWRRSGSLVFAAGTAVAAVFVCRPFLDIRAQLFLFLGTLAVLAVVEAYRHGARPWTPALLPIVMLLWTNLHFSFVSVPFGAKNLALVRQRWLAGRTGVSVAELGGAALACVAALAVLAVRLVPEARATLAAGVFEGLTDDAYFPHGAVEFLRQNPLPGRLFHLYTWGGYLMYWLPERKVFIDGR